MNLLLGVSQFVLVILSALVLGKLFGVYGILSCFLVSDALSLLTVYVFYQIKNRKTILSKKELLTLPDEFELHPGDVILMNGDLGAGKTQFVQGIAQGLGMDDQVTSPTFNILLSYENDVTELPSSFRTKRNRPSFAQTAWRGPSPGSKSRIVSAASSAIVSGS